MLLYALILLAASLITLSTIGATHGVNTHFLEHQLLFTALAVGVYGVISNAPYPMLRNKRLILSMYGIGVLLLILVLIFGSKINGSRAWFNFGAFSFQPSDLMKIFFILLLSRYLASRHRAINSIRHIFVTATYLLIPFILIFLQPDFGTSLVFISVWFFSLVVSGISFKHIITFIGFGCILVTFLWMFIFRTYQKERILSFIEPLSDIRGSGYNAYQSTIAVGSGQLLGKGVGYGTQSRLQFLPEHQTDFIFASFSEEWGFIGSILILLIYALIITKIFYIGFKSKDNYSYFICMGTGIYFSTHIIVNIGMNVGILPVTGITLPFMSYGGSHLITEFFVLGIISMIEKESIQVNYRYAE